MKCTLASSFLSSLSFIRRIFLLLFWEDIQIKRRRDDPMIIRVMLSVSHLESDFHRTNNSSSNRMNSHIKSEASSVMISERRGCTMG